MHYSINDSSAVNGPLLGVPAQDRDENNALSLDTAIASFLCNEYQAPLVVNRSGERITVVGLFGKVGKGTCVLVVYENGQTERYENLFKTSKGSVVALSSGRIVELFA